MATIVKTTFQLRRGLLATWEKNNPILAAGEPSYVIDKNLLKIGDGTTHWNDLEFLGGNSEIQNLLVDENSVIIIEDKISLKGFAEALPGAQPIKNENGQLVWVVPNTTVEKVEESVKKLEQEVYKKEEIDNLFKEINVNTLVQNEKEYLVLYGGSASDNI